MTKAPRISRLALAATLAGALLVGVAIACPTDARADDASLPSTEQPADSPMSDSASSTSVDGVDAGQQDSGTSDAASGDAEADVPVDEWALTHPVGWGDDTYPGPNSSDVTVPHVGSNITRRLDAYLSMALEKSHIPGLSVALVDRYGVLYSNSLGDVDSGDTPFIIGSLSKSFTGVGIMCLVQDGKVDLDAPVTDYLPGLDLGATVTIRQLLNQTSGLGTYQSVATAQVVGQQGSFNYANVNYDLLGEVIESASGESYDSFMRARVFEPLGLEHTYASLPDALEAGLAPGHRNWFGFYVNDGFTHATDEGAWGREPSGYISSSSLDMGRYLQMYLRGGDGVLTPESCSEMFNSNVYDEESDTYYGMGWTSYLWDMEVIQSHDGDVENYASSMCVLPARGLGIVLLVDGSDYTYGNYATYTMMSDIITIAMGDDPALDAVTEGTDQGDAASDQAGSDGEDADDSVQGDGSNDQTESVQQLVFGTTLADADGSEYSTAHASVNVTFAIYLLACALPFLLASRWPARILSASPVRRVVGICVSALVFFGIPCMTLSSAPSIIGMDWVEIRDFTPDVAVVIMAGCALLVANGIVRLALFLRARREATAA